MSYRVNGCNIYNTGRCLINTCKVLGKCVCTSCQMIPPSGTTAGRPSAPSTGSLYFDTDEGSLVAYSGTEWTSVGGGGDGIDGSSSFYTANCPVAIVAQSYGCSGFNTSDAPVSSLYSGSPNNCGKFIFSTQGTYYVCHRCLVACDSSHFIPNCDACSLGSGHYVLDSYRISTNCGGTDGSINVLNDGSFYTESSIDHGSNSNCRQNALYMYQLCAPVNYQHDTVIHRSDGKVGILKYPITFSSPSLNCCFTQCGSCMSCHRAPGFTHAAFPYGRAACGSGKITVQAFAQYNCPGYLAVTDASNLGKLKFNFDYLVCGYTKSIQGLASYAHRACMDTVNAPNNRITFSYSEPNLCNESFCMSPFSLRGWEDWMCNCAWVGCNLCYGWQCCWKVRPHIFTRCSYADQANYCTSSCDCICDIMFDTPFCTRRHRYCYAGCVFGVARTAHGISSQYICGPAISYSQLSTLYNPCTEKLFVGFKERNNCCCCCQIACTCNASGCYYCGRDLPTMRIYCATNGCCCGTISYCGICSSCSYPWALIGACMFGAATSCCFPFFVNGKDKYAMSGTCSTRHYFLSAQGNLPCEINCSRVGCCNPYFIAIFCETSCNWGIDNPFSGNCPNSIANHPYNGFMDLCCCSVGWNCIKASCASKIVPLPYCGLCYKKSPDFQGSAYINPTTDSAVFAFAISYLQACRYVPAWAGFACWDLINKCWASAFHFYSQICDVHCTGIANPCSIYGTCINSCNYAGGCNSGLSVGFLPYDDGYIFQTQLSPFNNCFGTCKPICIACCCCTSVPCHRSALTHLIFKMPYDKPLSCVPGLTEDSDVAAYLNWPQALNCGCSSQGKSIYPLFCGISTSAWPRLCNCQCRSDNIFFFSGTDCINCPSAFYNACQNGCTACLMPGCCTNNPIYSRIAPCIVTLNTVTDCYHSEYLSRDYGFEITPVTEGSVPSSAAHAYCLTDDFSRWCYYTSCNDLISFCTPPSITYCT